MTIHCTIDNHLPDGKFFRIKWFLLLLLLITFFLAGCSHTVSKDVTPLVHDTSSYSLPSTEDYLDPQTLWWQALKDPQLDGFIRQALSNNLTLQQGYARLGQARALENQGNASRYPTIDFNADAKNSVTDNEHDNKFEYGLELSWEIDLWGRLASTHQASTLDRIAQEEDLEDLALLMSTQVARTYFQLVEQQLQLQLLTKQVKINSTFLRLITLRFANGAASVVDVYQQRLLLAGIRAKQPLVKAQIVVLTNQLHVLLGLIPKSQGLTVGDRLPQLPPPPKLGVPADLLLHRPDLRKLQSELLASDHRVAAAVANRLPQLKIGGSLGFTDGDFFRTFLIDGLASIVDWGKRKNDVKRRKSIIMEKLSLYSEGYLNAIKEVENGLWQERYHRDHIDAG